MKQDLTWVCKLVHIYIYNGTSSNRHVAIESHDEIELDSCLTGLGALGW